MIKEIRLSQDKVALIDDEDYDWLSTWKWTALKSRRTWYAIRHDYSLESPVNLYMHRLIMRPHAHMIVDHLDGNGLNNQKANLEIITRSEHRRRHPRGKAQPREQVRWFGDQVRLMRAARGLTLRELQERTGISYSRLSQLERDGIMPKREVVIAIKQALEWPEKAHVAFEILMGDLDPEPITETA